MTADPLLGRILCHLRAGGRVALFLDYDGTLTPIAPTPEEAWPDQELLALLDGLSRHPQLIVTILSGRALASLQTLLPVPGLRLAGTYGVEVREPHNGVVLRADPTRVRPVVEQVKDAWSELVRGRSGFLVEDKGMAVALHARLASTEDQETILPQAQAVLTQLTPTDTFRVLGGHLFLEVAPAVANKGNAVTWLLERYQNDSPLPVYFGDDDKDEEAFAVILAHDGIPIVVGAPRGESAARVRLRSPADTREWLMQINETRQVL